MTWCVLTCQHHTEIGTDMKKMNWPNVVISIHHRSYVSLNSYTWSFRVHENAWARPLCLVSPHLMCFIKVYQRCILSYQIRQLPCRARGARPQYLFSHLTFRMDSFVHVNVLFFPLINRLVFTIQSSQTLDALITYFA